jgi:sugar phosphate isomerase/epimerase
VRRSTPDPRTSRPRSTGSPIQPPPRDIEDADRLLPGRGVIRLAALIAMLRAGGYRGPWSLETFNPDFWAASPEEIAMEGRAAVATLLDAHGLAAVP